MLVSGFAFYRREQAHRLVRQALGDQVRESIRAATPSGGSRDTVEWLLRISKAGDAIDLARLDGAADEINVNVTRCEYAEFFDQLDEPELGFCWSARSTTTSQTARA